MTEIQLTRMNKLPVDDTERSSKANDSNYGSTESGLIPIFIIPTNGRTNPAYEPDVNETEVRRRYKPKEAEEDLEADYDSESSEEEEPHGAYARRVAGVQNWLGSMYTSNKKIVWWCIYAVLILLYFAYFGYSMYKTFSVDDEGAMRLLVCTIIVVVFIVGSIIWDKAFGEKGPTVNFFEESDDPAVKKRNFIIHMVLAALFVLGAVIYIIVEVAVPTPRNLISLAGIAFFIISFYIFSYNPAKVNWRPVFWGIILQFYFALIILRTRWGFLAFEWAGNRIKEFLAYTDAGSSFIFGPTPLEERFFAFKVLPIIIFFSSAISVLYHLGVMQFIIRHIARFLAWCLGTSPAESLNAAGNIFIGQSEAPLMIRPFLKDMTKSELHAVMTGGFATIAGSVMATYILMGIPANHLLSASVMSAPAALAMSKLFYPETKKSKGKASDVYNIAKGKEYNFIEAASNGACVAVSLIANIAVNLIAFIAFLAFINATLVWFGHRAGLHEPELTFELICSYVFWPIAYLMGVDYVDCLDVASLIGTKTFINEYVAYDRLKVFIANGEVFGNYVNNVTGTSSGIWEHRNDDIWLKDTNTILANGLLTDRSVVIATYALCGFSNLSSMGIMLGALGTMAPNQKSRLSRIVFRAMISGNVACFMTASIAEFISVDIRTYWLPEGRNDTVPTRKGISLKVREFRKLVESFDDINEQANVDHCIDKGDPSKPTRCSEMPRM